MNITAMNTALTLTGRFLYTSIIQSKGGVMLQSWTYGKNRYKFLSITDYMIVPINLSCFLSSIDNNGADSPTRCRQKLYVSRDT